MSFVRTENPKPGYSRGSHVYPDGGKEMQELYAKFLKDYGTEIKALMYKLEMLEGKLREFFKIKSYDTDTYTNGSYKIDIEAKLKEYLKMKFYYTNVTDKAKLSVLEAELKEFFNGNITTYATRRNDKLDIWMGKLVEYFKIKFNHTYATAYMLSVLETELRKYFKTLSDANLNILIVKLKVYFKIKSYDTYSNGKANGTDKNYEKYYHDEYQKLKKEIKDLQYAQDQFVYAKEGKMNLLVNKLNDLLAKYKVTKTYPTSSNYYKILTSTFEKHATIEKDLVEKMMNFEEKLFDFEDRILYDEIKLDEFYDEKKWRRGMNGLYNTR